MTGRVLVTGGNGFIGSALVKQLLADGWAVRCLAHRSWDRLQRMGGQVEVVKGSVTRPDSLPAALKGVTLVFHLAALVSDWGPSRIFFDVNAQGTRNLLDAAQTAGVQRFVHMSSLAVHRFTGFEDADETVPADQERYAYGASKAEAERQVWQVHGMGHMACTVIRPGLVILGPEDMTTFMHMARLLQKGRWFHVNGGRPLLCYSYVENLVRGMVLAGTREEGAGECLLITDDIKLCWRELIDALLRAFNQPDRSLSVPGRVALLAGWTLQNLWRLVRAKHPPAVTRYRSALVRKDCHFSCEKAKRLLGYAPQVGFEEGLRRTVQWYRDFQRSREAPPSPGGTKPLAR